MVPDDGEVELARGQGYGGQEGTDVVCTDRMCRLVPVVEDGESGFIRYISESTCVISYENVNSNPETPSFLLIIRAYIN